MLIGFSCLDNCQGCRNDTYFVECMVDTYIVVLRNLAGRGLVCSYDLTSAHPCVCEIIFLYCSVFCHIDSFVVITFLFLSSCLCQC